MAFSGLSVVAAYAGPTSYPDKPQAILGKIMWTEEPASGTPTSNSAPQTSPNSGQPIFRIRASVDSWVSIGSAPNASVSPRFLVAANTDYDVFVDKNDKLAWVAA